MLGKRCFFSLGTSSSEDMGPQHRVRPALRQRSEPQNPSYKGKRLHRWGPGIFLQVWAGPGVGGTSSRLWELEPCSTELHCPFTLLGTGQASRSGAS